MTLTVKIRQLLPIGLGGWHSDASPSTSVASARSVPLIDGGAERERCRLRSRLGAREARWRLYC